MQTLRDIAHRRIRAEESKKEGYGTFTGVFLPSFITMVGALLFLNLGSLVAVSGIVTVVLALVLSMVITWMTALSVTSVASNTRVGAGGMYYMLSRSFGYELGAAVGISLYIAHALAAILCIMGLASSLSTLLPQVPIEFLRLSLLIFVTLFAYTSTKLALQLQTVVFIVIAISLLLFILGPYQTSIEVQGFFIDSIPKGGFWHTFSLIYPALVGIEAGAAMSGELKRTRFSLIVGTLLVTLVGFIFYLIITFVLWSYVPQEVLLSNKNILQYLSPLGPLALIGLWSATLFSAMGCLVTAPTTLSAMAVDGLFPNVFKNFRLSTLLTACLVGLGVSIGSMGGVVPVLTKVILIVYGMLNLSVVIEHLIGSPSWRPSVHVSPINPAIGAILCFVAMFMMNAGEAFLACGMISIVTILVKKGRVISKWDDMRQSILFSLSRFAIYRLFDSKQSHRSWRPNFLILSQSASLKTPLLGFTNHMSHGQGFLTLASVLKTGNAHPEELEKWERVIRANLKKKKVDALVEVTIADNLVEGLQNIITHFGIRPLVPNTVVLGESISEDHFDSYLSLIKIAAESKRNVLILRGERMEDEYEGKEIDLWYDPQEKKNCELMIILAHLLIKSKAWRKSTITLKCLVDSEVEREYKKEYFEHYFNECRLSMTAKIILREEDDLATIAEHSTKQGVVFVPMSEPDETFGDTYKNTMDKLKEIPNLCLVLCKEEIDLKKILQ